MKECYFTGSDGKLRVVTETGCAKLNKMVAMRVFPGDAKMEHTQFCAGMSAAWLVAEGIRAKDRKFELEHHLSDIGYGWYAPDRWECHLDDIMCKDAPTPTLAICFAALIDKGCDWDLVDECFEAL